MGAIVERYSKQLGKRADEADRFQRKKIAYSTR